MKHLLKLYRSNPLVAFIFDCFAFLAWAVTFIFMITIMTVALAA